jgi:hypothetical protein
VVLITGLANLVAIGFGMGIGEYLSSSAEYKLMERNRRRQLWEYDSYPQQQLQSMRLLYQQHHGFTAEETETLLAIFVRHPDFLVDQMLACHGLAHGSASSAASAPFKQGLVMFLSFCLFGTIPLLGLFAGKYQLSDGFCQPPASTFPRSLHCFLAHQLQQQLFVWLDLRLHLGGPPAARCRKEPLLGRPMVLVLLPGAGQRRPRRCGCLCSGLRVREGVMLFRAAPFFSVGSTKRYGSTACSHQQHGSTCEIDAAGPVFDGWLYGVSNPLFSIQLQDSSRR